VSVRETAPAEKRPPDLGRALADLPRQGVFDAIGHIGGPGTRSIATVLEVGP